MIRDPLAVATTILALAVFSFWLAKCYSWARKLSATLLVILFGALLSNTGLITPVSPVYDFIGGPLTSLAIVWLLLAVDLRDLRRAGPRMLVAFGVGVGATITGALVASAVLQGSFGGEGWKLAGTMTGTYSGGGLNFVAVGRALELPERLFAAATAADNVMTVVWMGATLLVPLWLAPWYQKPGQATQPAQTKPTSPEADQQSQGVRSLVEGVRFDLMSLGILFGLGLALVLAAESAAAFLPGPSIVWLTTLALATGLLPAVRRLEGALLLGTFALTLFFAVLGIGSRLSEVLAVGIEVFYFAAIVVLVHGALIYSVGRLLRIDLDTLSVASQAAVGGPSTALALAVARERTELVLPGTIVGLLGYALGTYAGLAVGALVRALGW